MASVILGDWTHRRGDAGGARAVPAEIDRPRPAVVWSWRPEHGGRVDQVRVAGTTVIVATMMPRDPKAPRWEHAVVYVLDAHTGIEIARRVLPDPVPVAAMVVDDGSFTSSRRARASPSSGTPSPRPSSCRAIAASSPWPTGSSTTTCSTRGPRPTAGCGSSSTRPPTAESARVRSFAFADPSGPPVAARVNEGRLLAEGPPVAHDACAGGHELFVPLDGRWSGETDSTPPGHLPARPRQRRRGWPTPPGSRPRSSVRDRGSTRSAATASSAPWRSRRTSAKPDHTRVEVFAVDRTSGVVRWRAHDDRLAIKPQLGAAARVARRPNGEVLFQSLGPDGTPCTPLICARPDGRLDAIVLGARGRYVLDAALGDLVLAHRENKDGRVEVGGFAIDLEGRLLGRRAVPRWTIDLGDLGGAATVYAGAGRGRRPRRALGQRRPAATW